MILIALISILLVAPLVLYYIRPLLQTGSGKKTTSEQKTLLSDPLDAQNSLASNSHYVASHPLQEEEEENTDKTSENSTITSSNVKMTEAQPEPVQLTITPEKISTESDCEITLNYKDNSDKVEDISKVGANQVFDSKNPIIEDILASESESNSINSSTQLFKTTEDTLFSNEYLNFPYSTEQIYQNQNTQNASVQNVPHSPSNDTTKHIFEKIDSMASAPHKIMSQKSSTEENFTSLTNNQKETDINIDSIPQSSTEDTPMGKVNDSNDSPKVGLLDKILDLKVQGNQAFVSGKYFKALELYSKALEYCGESENQLRSIILCNKAACHQKMLKWDQVIKFCNLSIELDPKNTKAYTRRLNAFESLQKWDDAYKDITTIIELDPSLKKHYAHKQNTIKQLAEEKEKKTKEEMMTQLKSLGNNILGSFGMSLDDFKVTQKEGGSYSIQYGKSGTNQP